ncbi:MAG TPA: hypothetical protein V6D03_02405, partial [Candidatus Caenarcaniphilales bacterium]
MKEILYLEVPTPDLNAVKTWLQKQFEPAAQKRVTPSGVRLQFPEQAGELSIFVWSVQRTTYLKMFRWAEKPLLGERPVVERLIQEIRLAFPYRYPSPPVIDLASQSIFNALAADYPLTVKYFRKMPQGEADLSRVYWWEQQWRQGVRHPQQPRPVVFSTSKSNSGER